LCINAVAGLLSGLLAAVCAFNEIMKYSVIVPSCKKLRFKCSAMGTHIKKIDRESVYVVLSSSFAIISHAHICVRVPGPYRCNLLDRNQGRCRFSG
jgi:hypothetical protein